MCPFLTTLLKKAHTTSSTNIFLSILHSRSQIDFPRNSKLVDQGKSTFQETDDKSTFPEIDDKSPIQITNPLSKTLKTLGLVTSCSTNIFDLDNPPVRQTTMQQPLDTFLRRIKPTCRQQENRHAKLRRNIIRGKYSKETIC